jgi:hypothetical protein
VLLPLFLQGEEQGGRGASSGGATGDAMGRALALDGCCLHNAVALLAV